MNGEDPVLNKAGLIIKEKDGVVKKRMTFDTRVSGRKGCAKKSQRVLLPLVLDGAIDPLNL